MAVVVCCFQEQKKVFFWEAGWLDLYHSMAKHNINLSQMLFKNKKRGLIFKIAQHNSPSAVPCTRRYCTEWKFLALSVTVEFCTASELRLLRDQ